MRNTTGNTVGGGQGIGYRIHLTSPSQFYRCLSSRHLTSQSRMLVKTSCVYVCPGAEIVGAETPVPNSTATAGLTNTVRQIYVGLYYASLTYYNQNV